MDLREPDLSPNFTKPVKPAWIEFIPEPHVAGHIDEHRSTSPDVCPDGSKNVNRKDALDTVGRKIFEAPELIRATNLNIFSDGSSETGNVSEDMEEVLRTQRCSDPRLTLTLDTGEDVTNDSGTDDADEVGWSLQRNSFARQPIYPGQRSVRCKLYQPDVVNAEGGTSKASAITTAVKRICCYQWKKDKREGY